MAEIGWIKITTDMFDNRKIKYLRKLPNGNDNLLIWTMLLTIAGRCNADGKIFLTESMPYTLKMLSDELEFDESIIDAAIEAMEQLDMVEYDDGYLKISGWQDHQNTAGMERIREQSRKRVSDFRERKKTYDNNAGNYNTEKCNVTNNNDVTHCNVTGNVTVTQCNATDKDIDKDKDIDLKEKDKKENITCKHVTDLYHQICVSYPKVNVLSDTRKKAINARLKTYSLDDFRIVFQKAQESRFLNGENDRNWTANFDWLIKDSNFAKVMDGNYDNKDPGSLTAIYGAKKNSFLNFEPRSDVDYKVLERELAQRAYDEFDNTGG